MTKFKAWINAARLRTLPLSISGILVGSALASYYGNFDLVIFWLAIFTTIGFQVTSNFANDYGDGIKGTDNQNRIGPKRMLQSGLLSRKALKRGIVVSIIIDVLLVVSLLFFSFGRDELGWILFFLILGGLSIWAAIKYTIGKNAYGYQGLGDIFVFLFFGLVGVLGSMFLFIKTIPLSSLFPAIAIGLLSAAVLNLNNLRDHQSDKESGKNTLVVKIGFLNGKLYHLVLLAVAFLSILMFMIITANNWKEYIGLLAFIPIIFHATKVKSIKNPAMLDPELKKLALSTFLMALLFYFSYYNFS
ncbi:1,4-dihydroxy-2-naphthoate octaprenyltransferase [Maribacter cobaltidurans]|uniref:1,4-dihydroxy-2-naphthoate octaprenyltransferase n=1 Tax=Maribacter cobaltidurans TaxID=1178778 RepID=A0A223V0I3_9FLAO|nr:1,4-dihydroxy-2-naphthoate octaprenyltransferase [Maribacter cobaltidurans]ASV28814.1 1,4-dihydroxy-2-naphthoate octaprenyltransferase [Maribacter cobaltidurans]GGD74596.1 1,4-dihydroxy-2-naphthoate octaprenyltransferase [Maribacter cobaltidurans]